jgi:Flp pilus assembly protein CpaB
MDDARLRDLADRVMLAVGGPRRLLAAACAGLAVLAAVKAVTPPAPRTVAVWVAAHDLSGGSPLGAHDVRLADLPAQVVPAGAVASADRPVGRLLAAPMRQGEPLTDVRLLGQSLLSALPQQGLVAVPVRVADGSAAAALVQPGDVVDVLAAADPDAGTGSTRPATVASAVRVLAVPARVGTAGDGGGLVVVAVDPLQAAALARASASARLSLALRRS